MDAFTIVVAAMSFIVGLGVGVISMAVWVYRSTTGFDFSTSLPDSTLAGDDGRLPNRWPCTLGEK